ncbi:MAG: hypothetical protein KAI24_17725, partial [Planctomycetes bacterium]|nr:hypothetical protein [Planctomycetota bacterium]
VAGLPRRLPVLYEFLWTALGVAVAMAATRAWRVLAGGDESANAASTEAPSAAPSEPPDESRPEPSPRSIDVAITPETHEMALSLAEELANLVSAVEARAHHLIEAAPTRTQLPSAAEAMLASVKGLRTLHTKLVAMGRGRRVEGGTTDVSELIASLADELQLMQLGLELRWDPPPELPRIDANPDAVRDAILFVCAALLRAERGATRLTFSTERSFSRERPTIKIELHLEWISVPGKRDTGVLVDQTFALDWEAAKNLVLSHGGELTFSHLPGKAARALVRFPIAIPIEDAGLAEERDPAAATRPQDPPPAVAASAPPPAEPDPHHEFGGALVLESDPVLRAVLARELKASGRAVFACADGASAHTFLQATPDRFELLIVDDAQQLDDDTPLARTIRARTPSLKICLLTPTPQRMPPQWPGMHCLMKPFGVHELRRTLASILTAG